MRKIKILFFILLFIPFLVCAKTCDKDSITIKSIDLENKTEGVEEKTPASINYNNISLNLSMSNVSDVVEYKVVLKNTSNEDYILDKDTFNNNTNYIKYTIETEDNSNVIKGNSEKEVLLKVEYENEVPDEVLSDNKYNDNKNLVINLTNDKDGIINPYTGNVNSVLILMLALTCGVLLYVFVNRKQGKFFILLLLLLPLTISAACVTSINVESNVQINKKEVKPSILMEGTSGNEETYFLRTNITKNDIETIAFTSSLGNHTPNGTDCFDVSKDNDGSVLAWIADSDNDGLYEITIGANGKVYASSGNNLFSYLGKITSIDFSSFDTSLVSDMSYMFFGTINLEGLDLSNFDTSNVFDMTNMFSYCIKMESLNITSFDTSKVTSMYGMFSDCNKLTSLDVSNFNTSNVISMQGMFSGCKTLTSLNVSTFNTSKVTDMSSMFTGCENLTVLDLSNFDTSDVIGMSGMFHNCYNLISLDLSSFETSNVFNMRVMFSNCSNLKTIYANDNFDTSKVTDSNGDYMFYGCTSLVGGNGTTFDSNYIDKEYAIVDKDETPGYFTNKNSKTATIYYNSNNTLGELTVSTKKVSCVPEEGSSTCTITIPSTVTNSVGKYNSAYKGISDELGSLSNSSLTINTNKVLYAYYGSEVTNYYYDSSYKSRTIYRNEYLTSLTEMGVVLSTNETGMENYSYSSGPGSSEWIGLSTAKDTTVEYNNISDAARSESNTLYSVYKFTVTLENGSNVISIGGTSASCNITTSDTSCDIVLPSVTPQESYTSVGWSETRGSTKGVTIYTVNSNNKVLYANAIIAYYQNTATNAVYATLNDAFSDVANNQTIKVIKDKSDYKATLENDKTGIKLDLNGKSVSFVTTPGLTVLGELDIYNTSTTSGSIVELSNSTVSEEAIENKGILTFNKTSSDNEIKIIYNNKYDSISIIHNRQNMSIYGNVEIKYGISNSDDYSRQLINNSGTLNIYNLSMQCNLDEICIVNSGTLNYNSGTINSIHRETIINKQNGIANIESGTFTNTFNENVISNSGQMNITGNDVSITGYTGIYNSGTLTMTGGTITASNNGIYAYNGTLTLGVDDSTVSTTSPTIISTGASYNGISRRIDAILNFYDGIIKSKVGTGSALNRDPNSIPNGYSLYKETIDGVESAFLVKDGYLMSSGASAAATKFLRTNTKRQDIETITFTNSISDHTVNGIDCFDVSKDEDGSVLAWVTDIDSNNLYEITIGAYGKVYATSGFYLFSSLTNLDSINGMNHFDTSKVTSMTHMFDGCSNITTLDLSHFDTSNVTNMEYMFRECTNIVTLDLSHFNTSSVSIMLGMFYKCLNMKSLNMDNFDTSNVTNMALMFGSCESLETLDVSNFNTSNVIRMGAMFDLCKNLTELNLSNFNTSNVTQMYSMFSLCKNLTSLDLSNFDTRNVTAINAIFYGCENLTDINISSFDTSNVTTMAQMFEGCTNLASIDLSHFDTSKVKIMSAMFSLCPSLTSLDLSNFDTSKVTNMHQMFNKSTNLTNLDLTNFDTSNVTNMSRMFYNCSNLTGLNLGSTSFNTSNVTNMKEMFYGCKKLVTIYAGENFVTTLVTDSTSMFNNCTSLVGGLGTRYNSSNVDAAYAHIDGGTSNPGYFTGNGGTLSHDYLNWFNNNVSGSIEVITLQNYIGAPTGSLGSWDASESHDNSVMGYYTDTDNNGLYEVTIASNGLIFAPQDSVGLFSLLNLTTINNLKYLNTSNVTNMSAMFASCEKLTSLDLSHFDTSNVTNMQQMFWITPLLVELDVSSFDTSNVTNMSQMFSTLDDFAPRLERIIGIESFDTSNVTNMYRMFYYSVSLKSLDLSNWNTSNVTNMEQMFNHCGVETLDVSNFDTSKITSMFEMFRNTNLTSLDLSSFNTSKVTYMNGVFWGNENLTNLDISSFDTSKVTSMQFMFMDCSSLTSLDLSNFDTSNVFTMEDMFYQCTNLTSLNLSGFNTKKVTNMGYMFRDCTSLTTLDLSSFDTSALLVTENMFYGCSNLVTILVSDKFNVSNVTSSSGMFSRCTSIVGGNGTTYNSSYTTKTYARIDADGTPGYFTESNVLKAVIHYNSNRTDGLLTPSYKVVSCTPADGQTTCMITLPSEVIGSIGKYNSNYIGISDSKESMNQSNLIIDSNTHLYAIYSSEVTYHYYGDQNAWTTKTLYRNEMFSSNNEIKLVLATTNTGTTNYDYDDDYNPGNAYYVGLSTSQDTEIEFEEIEDAADSSASEIYNVFSYYVYFEIGENVESIGTDEIACYFTVPNTTCTIVLPTITPKEGYTSVGWSLISGDTTGNPALSIYTLNTNDIVLYANAIESN